MARPGPKQPLILKLLLERAGVTVVVEAAHAVRRGI